MKKTQDKDTQNLDELFEKYRRAPESFVFVPLADACRKTGQIEEALEICERGVARHPGYASGHVVKGKCMYDLGDREGARRVFKHVLTLDENNLVALKFLGTIEADEGNLEQAQKHLQQILALDPENAEIRQILHLVEEQEQIQRAGEAEPELGDADMAQVDEILASGEIQPVDEDVDSDPVEDSDPDEAASGVSEDLETSDELASITLADIFASQGYTKKAERIYEEVLRKQPGSVHVKRKLAALRGESFDEPAEAAAPNVDENPAEGETPEPTPKKSVEPTIETAPEPASSDDDGHHDRRRSKKSKRSKRHAQKKREFATPPISDDARPEIAEGDSLNHFRQWLKRVQS